MIEDLRGQAEAMLARLPSLPNFLGLKVTVVEKRSAGLAAPRPTPSTAAS